MCANDKSTQLCMHTWSAICMQMVKCSTMCTQMVEYSGSYVYILVFIYVYTNGRVLRYVYVYLSSYLCTQLVQCFDICLPMEKGSTIYHPRLLWTSKAAGHGGLLLQQWLVRVITYAYGLL